MTKANPRDGFMSHVRTMDRALVASGAYPSAILTSWWTSTLETFFASFATMLVVRAGRQSRKSTVACLLMVCWCLYGKWQVPRGATAIVPFLSVDKGEAAERLRTIASMLTALGIGHSRRGDEIELTDRNVILRVYAASIRSVGMTAIAVACDEVSRWREEATGANPATEVVASVRPAMVTQMPFGAFMLCFSSPLTESDFHAERVREGNTAGQLVFTASTWVANPDVSEATTRELEPNLRVWSREFLAEPQASSVAAFPDGIEHLIARGVKKRPYQAGNAYFLVFDMGGPTSATTGAVFHFELDDSSGKVTRPLINDCVEVLKPTLFRKVTFAAQKKMIVDLRREYHIQISDLGDRHKHSELGEQLGAEEGIVLPVEPAGMSLKDQAARSTALLDRSRARTILLLDHPDVVSQLKNAVEVERAGKFIIETSSKRSQPDDVLDLILLACDERYRKVPASGGAIEKVWIGGDPMTSFLNALNGIGDGRHTGRWAFMKRSPNGTPYEVSPPRLAREFEEQRSARLARGDSTQQDRDDLGEEEFARRLGRG